jgi:hypothetical protein
MLTKIKEKTGVAFLSALVVITVLLLFSAAFAAISINNNWATDIYLRRAKAYDLAESGLDRAINWLRAQGTPPVGNHTNPWGGAQSLGGGSYSVVIADLGVVGAGPSRRYKATSTGTYGNMNRVLINYIQVDNYARYLWFTDKETYGGSTVWFFSLDHLNGPTQTNSNYNIMGTPQFDAQVESVADYIRFYNNGNNINLNQSSNAPYDIPVFAQGITFGTEPTTMPTQALNLRSAATAGGLSLTGNTTVVLNSNGTMNVTNSAKSWNNTNMALPGNGALFVNSGNLTVSGTLKGQLSVGASKDIVIPNNLTYATDPRTNPSSSDVLGIISEGDVKLPFSNPNNLEIDGCIMALGSSFYLDNYTQTPAKGTLTVYGGIIQSERGPVGTFNGATGQKLSGYSKNYLYDARLLSSPPPFIPTTGDYVTISWEED